VAALQGENSPSRKRLPSFHTERDAGDENDRQHATFNSYLAASEMRRWSTCPLQHPQAGRLDDTWPLRAPVCVAGLQGR